MMDRKFIQEQNEVKQQIRKKHRKTYSMGQRINQISVKIILQLNQYFYINVPFECSLKELNRILINKIKQLKTNQIIGFQTIPPNINFDYRLSKSIGYLKNLINIQLKCIFKDQNLQENLKKIQQRNKKCKNYQYQTSYNINKYKICNPLSSGGFSQVYLVRNLINGQFYAAKFMDKKSPSNIDRQQSIMNQFQIHKNLNHPFIVKMYQFIQTSKFYILILQYCPGGQLFNLLKKNRFMKEQKARVIFAQILMAVKYLHNKNIIYRDIKPQNILIDQKGNAKLADFGLSKIIRDKTDSYCGSLQYMAPQIILKKSYSFQVDLYCMGALLYEILIGCPPFYHPKYTNEQTKRHICYSEVIFPKKIILSKEVRNLIQNLLIKNPISRFGYYYGIQEILNHQWMLEFDIQALFNKQIKNPFFPNLQIQHFQQRNDEQQEEKKLRFKIYKQMQYYKRLLESDQKIQKTQKKDKSKSVGILYKNRKQSLFVKKDSIFVSNSFGIRRSFNNSGQNFIYKHVRNLSNLQLTNTNGFNHYRKNQKIQKNTSFIRKSQIQQNKNIEIENYLFVNNHKSQIKNKNQSLKKFIKNNSNEKLNKMGFLAEKISKRVIFSSNNIKKQYIREDKKQQNSLQNSCLFKKNKINNKNCKEQQKQNRIFDKQLKKKNMKNKRKYQFQSMPKQLKI